MLKRRFVERTGTAETIVVLQQHDDAEHHRRRADDGGADEHRLGGGFEGVARAVAFFQLVLGVLEVGVETEVPFDFRLDVLARLRSGSTHRPIGRCR